MIQRKQSLYLLLAGLLLGTLFLFDAAWPGGHTDVPQWVSSALLVAAALMIGSTLWAIFLYKERTRQLKVVLLAQVFTIACIGLLLYGLWSEDELSQMMSGPDAPWKLVAVLLPFVVYVLLFLARKGIEHDIKLIRSVDRLR